MSAILSADTLNDFIAPSVACIKPIETLPPDDPSTADPSSSLEHEVVLDGSLPQQRTPAQAAQISLTDCLACSGCVTSAEAILVSLQSHSEVLSTLDAAPALRLGSEAGVVSGLEDENAKIFVASVAPQTRASLAAACGPGTSEREAGDMLDRLLREELGKGGKWGNAFTWVVDTNAAREMCLVLGAEEALSPDSKKPVLASSCPGWVCYAEKTHPHVLPYLSKVKSPQALTGTLLKTALSRRLGVPPSRIWHVAVMPCFDKKLEASREELTDAAWAGGGKQSGSPVRDVDCVITSKEVLMLAESRGINFFDLSKKESGTGCHPSSQIPFPDPALQRYLFPSQLSPQQPREASTSGGYLHFILQTVASRNPGSVIQGARGRNSDVMEYTVTSSAGEPLFRAARFYGFRNIQNLVRKLKPPKPSRMPGGRPFGSARRPAAGKPATLEYSYVEVMACPGGCTNGGGQIKVDDPIIMERTGQETVPGPQEQKEWLALVDEAYFSGGEDDAALTVNGAANGAGGRAGAAADLVGGISPSYINDTLEYWRGLTGIEKDRLVLTSFREVISDVGKDKSQVERAAQLAGKIGGGW
ncbi:related to nuclear prelamin A recognition factor [Cephalotrichum gorgonifer]|uniref:Nuclear architecture-related protein 1 n=1 Tax=Cephalotrichum gorgonifer TaxID=2041049 RepID=A0AAE8SQS4_9PEZI|nr:related to nuclear prelamin A recognition factor [Cephalotrichum gorgonifer]